MRKRYFFNREERFFCSQIMCALQDNPVLAAELFPPMGEKSCKNFEIYTEASVIRDYWMTFGKPGQRKKQELNGKREEYLRTLCTLLHIDFRDVTDREDYRSKRGYIQSPGNWSGLSPEDQSAKKLRAVFNMRQDLMMITGDSLHFVEAKLESGNAAQQIQNFLFLRDLLDAGGAGWAGIDSFHDIKEVHLYYLKRNRNPLSVDHHRVREEITLLTWKDVFDCIAGEPACQHSRLSDHITYLLP
ncbi:hypothetical protein OOT00_15220 [Desulfobotulus sp. H1]|uniref:Restriction endonuclease n=1 Tax=Desulfobotulus pelophilus TaxID=2823377 RepID=A0ABT3NCY5_9BACT|nr:hypothetical protein [Desulfobotulus pelophilus]MCW7755333.1 hypothetical protein [Desulfobotulus pelophilus]